MIEEPLTERLTSAGNIAVFNQQSEINNQQFFLHHYLRHVPDLVFPRYIILMSYGTGSAKYKCAQCEQPESSCECEKFCCLCQSVMDIRLCTDGLFYCEPCRSACDYKPAV